MKRYTDKDLQQLYGDVPQELYDRLYQSMVSLQDLDKPSPQNNSGSTITKDGQNHGFRISRPVTPIILCIILILVSGILIRRPTFLPDLLQPIDAISTKTATQPIASFNSSDDVYPVVTEKLQDEYEYTILNDDTIEITRYLGVDQETVIIPDTIDGYHVSSIGKLSFNHCYSIKSISIPDGVTYIGTYAFSNCTSLNTVTIPDTVTLIDCFAFEYCSSLTEMWIPDSVEAIGAQAFYYCSSLNNIRLPEKITVLYYGLFAHCRSLKTVLIPEFVTEIWDSAFAFCESLSDVHLPLGLKKIGNYAFGKCTELKTMTIPKSVEVIDRYAFLDCEKMHFIVTENSYAAEYCEDNGMHFKMLPEVKD